MKAGSLREDVEICEGNPPTMREIVQACASRQTMLMIAPRVDGVSEKRQRTQQHHHGSRVATLVLGTRGPPASD